MLVGLKVALDKLLLAEDFPQVLLLVGLLHRALEFAVAQHLVAVDVNLVDLDFLVLINVDVDDDLVLLAQVGHLHDFTRGLAETLVGIVFLYNELDAVGDVGRHLATGLETQALHDLFLLTALHAVVVHLGHAGLLAQVKHQPGLVLVNLFNKNLNLGEQSLAPKTLGSRLDIVTGYVDALAQSQSRIADDDVLVIVLHALDADARNLILRGCSRENDLGVIDGVVDRAGLLTERDGGQEACDSQHYGGQYMVVSLH